uniref:Sugar ABC transporter permease n=1 Tax=Dictyoglomus turgidum TaxID=513050 RepID=A0A7C3WWZ6_9BACT
MGKLQARWGILFALPAILGFLIWNLGPMIASFVISFTNWSIASRPSFINFENYKKIFDDFVFKKSLSVTFYYAVGSVFVGLIVALFWALLLNRNIIGQALFRTAFFLPAITPAIASSMIWLWLFNPTFGLLNSILDTLGLPPLEWIYNEKQVIPSFILMSIWGVGYTITIFLAGLQGIPQHLYEAVEIDGGSWWDKFRHVTVPMISPVIFFNLVMGLIGALQAGFAQAYIMTRGGPNYASMFYSYYVYLNAFEYGKMGYSCALSTIFSFMLFGLTILVFKTSPYWVYYEALRK